MKVLADGASNLLKNAFMHVVFGPSTQDEKRVILQQTRQFVKELNTKYLEYMAFMLLIKLDEEKRKGVETFGEDWRELCAEMFAEYDKRLERQERREK